MNELVQSEWFNLQDAIAALVAMDPKMDTGMVSDDPNPFTSIEHALATGAVPVDQVDDGLLIAFFDDLVVAEARPGSLILCFPKFRETATILRRRTAFVHPGYLFAFASPRDGARSRPHGRLLRRPALRRADPPVGRRGWRLSGSGLYHCGFFSFRTLTADRVDARTKTQEEDFRCDYGPLLNQLPGSGAASLADDLDRMAAAAAAGGPVATRLALRATLLRLHTSIRSVRTENGRLAVREILGRVRPLVDSAVQSISAGTPRGASGELVGSDPRVLRVIYQHAPITLPPPISRDAVRFLFQRHTARSHALRERDIG